jgi:hypothetical protein
MIIVTTDGTGHGDTHFYDELMVLLLVEREREIEREDKGNVAGGKGGVVILTGGSVHGAETALRAGQEITEKGVVRVLSRPNSSLVNAEAFG